MKWRNTAERYGILSVSLHWVMLAVLIAVYACIEMREFYPRGSDIREALKTWHFVLGLSVLVLVLLRILVMMVGQFPRIMPPPQMWQTISGKVMHTTLYLFMIFMPLAGWLLLSATGKPITFWSWHLPSLISESKNVADLFSEIHETGGEIGYFLVGIHATAALFHHYFLRDNALMRILP